MSKSFATEIIGNGVRAASGAALPYKHLRGRASPWDEERARRLTPEGNRALRRLKTERQGASSEVSARMEVLIVQKRAAYEARNIERYEAAIQAMVRLAQVV